MGHPRTPSVPMQALERDPRRGVAGIMEEAGKWFKDVHDRQGDALELARDRSRLIDEIIRALFHIAEERHVASHGAPAKRVAIFALGGYGREEMGLESDVDLLFLYEGGSEEYIREVTDSILYPFWDNKIEITGATRTIEDCASVGRSDLRAQTAMLDARFIAGDGTLSQGLISFIARQFDDKREKRRFIEAKLKERSQRLKMFGDSVYLLEPNVKESEGGLRDHHTLLWIAKAASGSVPCSRELCEGIGFLWRVRNALHLLGEKNDRLCVAHQDAIARSFGYGDGPFSAAAEHFMQDYYRHASTVHLKCQRAIEQMVEEAIPPAAIVSYFTNRRLGEGVFQVGDRITAGKEAVESDPLAMLKLFSFASERSLLLDARTKETVMTTAGTMTGFETFSDEMNGLWRQMFSRPASIHHTVKDMHECRLLARFFPEMGPLVHRIQHDGFHFYTADEHSLHALREVGLLFTKEGERMFPVPAEAAKRIKRPHVMTFATLFHDIGKGRGGNHAEVGAGLAGQIARRLMWGKEDQDDIAFLVRSHLLIPTLAYRRDVKDPHLAERLAGTVETPEMLSMLYLIAFADVRAMGPHIWSDWKGGLLAELYHNTLAHLEGGGEAAKRQRLLLKKLEKVREAVGDSISRDELGTYFESMPDRYLMQTKPDVIASHLKMTARLGERSVLTDVVEEPGKGFSELSVVTRDAPGLFAKMAGVLSMNGVNIIDAQLFTLPDGTVLDQFWVTDLNQGPIADASLWERIGEEISDAISGKLDVHEMMKRKTKRRLLSRGPKDIDAQIDIDNDVSVVETVVDVVTVDRAGLLYDISRAFADLGCSIDRAKITTYADRVIDVFYIRDKDGKKITSKERLRQIQEAITNTVS